MKKLITFMALVLCSTIVFANGDGPVWQWLDKLYIIKVGLPLLTLYCYIRGWKQSKSGSLETYNGGATRESKKNVPFYKCPATIYGYILTVVTIFVFILIHNDK